MAAPGILVAIAVLLLFFMYVGYAPAMLAFNTGATWGKQATVRLSARTRWCAGFSPRGCLPYSPYCASALMVGIQQDKRGLHD